MSAGRMQMGGVDSWEVGRQGGEWYNGRATTSKSTKRLGAGAIEQVPLCASAFAYM
jgi:hypothetical protein